MEVEEVKVVEVKVGAALTASSSEASAGSATKSRASTGVPALTTAQSETSLSGSQLSASVHRTGSTWALPSPYAETVERRSSRRRQGRRCSMGSSGRSPESW